MYLNCGIWTDFFPNHSVRVFECQFFKELWLISKRWDFSYCQDSISVQTAEANFLIFKKLIYPKLIIKFLQIFTEDTQENFAKHFLKRCARTNPWEQSFKRP